MSAPEKRRYFLALVPEGEVQMAAENIKQEIAAEYGVKAALRSPSHITLHMPFEWKLSKEHELIERLSEYRYASPFPVMLNGFGCFEPRVVFIHVAISEALRNMQDQLVDHVKRQLGLMNQAEDRRGFHPHMTMAFRDLKKNDFYPLWENYKDRAFQAEFMADRFCLLRHEDNRWQVLRAFDFISAL